MNWNNLKNYTCQKDGEPLKDIGHYHACTKCVSSCTECVFSIKKPKFDEIVNQKYKSKKCVTFEENLSALNNLDRKPLNEDFSDSNALDY